MQLLDRKPGESSKGYALRTIKENIINLTLEPGSQISENEIAAEIGLSRTPVREAILNLSKVKIVTIYPQKKGVISLIDYGLIDEYQFMRSNLEEAIMEDVCQTVTGQELRRLSENVRLQKFALENLDFTELSRLDKEFHGILFEIADKPLIYQVMNTISIHLDRVRRVTASPSNGLKSVQDHEDILAAMADRDVRRARALLEVHLTRYKADAATVREKFPQYVK